MRKLFLGLAAAVLAVPAMAQTTNPDPTIWVSLNKGLWDSGWVVTFPTGSSDFLSTGYGVTAGSGNIDNGTVAGGLPVKGVAVSSADFGSGLQYPVAGIFNPNLPLDGTGNTPDIGNPLTAFVNVNPNTTGLFQATTVSTTGAGGTIPGGATRVVGAAALPPGDSGLLGIGADSTISSSLSSGFTQDGYASAAIIATFIDVGVNPGQDNTATTSCKQADRKPHGRLRASNPQQSTGSGDHLTATVKAGDTLNLAFFGSKSGDKWRIYFNAPPCTPAVAIGPVLPTIPDPDGDGTFVRVNSTWPAGFGQQTFRFSAVWGNPACSNPGVGFTNCVTIITLKDPSFGTCDDGTVETGWVVSIPSGSNDHFNNCFNNSGGVNGVIGLTISVLDFGSGTVYPTSGVSNTNSGVGPCTPDISGAGLLATVSPFTFPGGTFATTSGLYISHAVSVPGSSLGSEVHGWVQFPPGDSGLLGVGGDTTASNSCSYFTQDGYSTPAISFFIANWGIRLATN